MSIGTGGGAGAEWLMQCSKINFPAIRIADALLNPGKTIDDNGKK